MTIKVHQDHFSPELNETRRGLGSTADLTYFITGTSSWSAARAALLAEVSDTFDSTILKKIRLVQIGLELFEASLNYSDAITSQPRWSFDTTGNTARVTHGFSEFRFGPGGADDANIPSMDGALQVIDGKVEGTEIVIPGLKFQITRAVPKWFMNDAYVDVIESLTGSVNQASYANRAAQSLLFLGATGSQSSKGNPEVTYYFVAGKHATLQIGQISGITKKAHQFLWVDWADVDIETAKRLAKLARGVYTNDVYPIRDWEPLTPPPEDAEEE